MASIRKMWVCKNTQCKNDIGKHRGYKKVNQGEKSCACKHCGVPMVLPDNNVVRITKDGKTHTKHVGASKKWATEYLADCVSARRKGELFPGEERLIHWDDAVEIFEKDMVARLANGKSQGTVLYYRGCIKALSESFGDRYLQDITREEVEAYRDAKFKTCGASWVNGNITILKLFYGMICDRLEEVAYRRLFLTRRSIQKVTKLTLPPGRDNILENDEEWNVLLSNAKNPVLHHFITCVFNTGLRHGDVLALRVSSIDFKANRIESKVKGSKFVRIPLTASYKAYLEAWIKNMRVRSLKHDWLFPRKDMPDVCMNVRSGMGWQAACKASAEHYLSLGNADAAKRFLNLVPHDLRHSFATRFLYAVSKEQGAMASVKILSDILGHSQEAITARYTHVIDEISQAAMKVYGNSVTLR